MRKCGLLVLVVFLLIGTSVMALAGPSREDFVLIGPSLGQSGSVAEIWHPSASYEGPHRLTEVDCQGDGVYVAIEKDGFLWRDLEVPDLAAGEEFTLNGYAWSGHDFTGTTMTLDACFFNTNCKDELACLAWFTPDGEFIQKGWISETNNNSFSAILPAYTTGYDNVPVRAARWTLNIYGASSVPEPGSMTAMLSGLIGLGGFGLCRRRA